MTGRVGAAKAPAPDQTVGRTFEMTGDRFDPTERCWSCGYAICVHSLPGDALASLDEGGCPTEVAALQRWGLM